MRVVAIGKLLSPPGTFNWHVSGGSTYLIL